MRIDLRFPAPEGLTFAAWVLNEAGYFDTIEDLRYFFEKPWKYAADLEEAIQNNPRLIGELKHEVVN